MLISTQVDHILEEKKLEHGNSTPTGSLQQISWNRVDHGVMYKYWWTIFGFRSPTWSYDQEWFTPGGEGGGGGVL